MKRAIALFSAVLLTVSFFGCAPSTVNGDPKAKEAAYNAASARTQLYVLAAFGDPNDGENNVEFIEAWEADGISYEAYQATEDVDSLDWHATWLIGVANRGGNEWAKIAEWDPVEASHAFSHSDIDAFKTYCEMSANPIDYEAIDESLSVKSGDASQDTAILLDEVAVYTNEENGMTLTLKQLSDEDGYAISFDDGNVFRALFNRLEMDNGGDEVSVYEDDGFGIVMRYCAVFPNQVEIAANSRGAQDYAGFYRAG